MQLTRARVRAADPTSRTIRFTYPDGSGRGNSPVGFVSPEHAPAFDGEEGWLELERVKAAPWSYWRAVGRLDRPPDA